MSNSHKIKGLLVNAAHAQEVGNTEEHLQSLSLLSDLMETTPADELATELMVSQELEDIDDLDTTDADDDGEDEAVIVESASFLNLVERMVASK